MMSLIMLAVGLIIGDTATASSISAEPPGRTSGVLLGCSRTEMAKLQSTWRWLVAETSVADKTLLFTGVINYIAARNSTVAELLTRGHTSGVEPLSLVAYRLFTDIDLYISTYTGYDTYVSHIEHMATTRTLWSRKIVMNIDILFDAIDKVIGGLILQPADKTLWTSCLENMAAATKTIVRQTSLHAKCDISRTSGDPAYPIEGSIGFSQPALGGRTFIRVDLTGFPTNMTSSQHGMHVHERGSLDDRCMQAGTHFNPHGLEHGAPYDDNRHVGDLGNISPSAAGKIIFTKYDDHIELHGTNNIVGKSVVIHALADDLGRGGFADSKTTGHAGGRIACCIVERTFE